MYKGKTFRITLKKYILSKVFPKILTTKMNLINLNRGVLSLTLTNECGRYQKSKTIT